jgi:GNAT superfamily N-acetyltransferase
VQEADVAVIQADARPWAVALTAVHERSATAAYAHIFEAPFPHEDAFAKWSAHQGPVWLALRDNQVLGFCALRENEIVGLYVLPEEANSGIGSALLAAAVDAQKLWVLEDNQAARGFYEQRGWSWTGRHQPAFGVTELLYTRPIAHAGDPAPST